MSPQMNLSLPSIPETRVRLAGPQVLVYLAMLFSCFGGTHSNGVSSRWPLRFDEEWAGIWGRGEGWVWARDAGTEVLVVQSQEVG